MYMVQLMVFYVESIVIKRFFGMPDFDVLFGDLVLISSIAIIIMIGAIAHAKLETPARALRWAGRPTKNVPGAAR
jgi:hypothetical protein